MSTDRGSGSAYLVPDGVRVRAEDFGLLFYDTRSTRLTFVRSGDRLVPPPFTGERRMLEVRCAEGAEPDEASRSNGGNPAPLLPGEPLGRLLDGLVAKGLLVVASEE